MLCIVKCFIYFARQKFIVYILNKFLGRRMDMFKRKDNVKKTKDIKSKILNFKNMYRNGNSKNKKISLLICMVIILIAICRSIYLF